MMSPLCASSQASEIRSAPARHTPAFVLRTVACELRMVACKLRTVA
jgi:hypothetical protein